MSVSFLARFYVPMMLHNYVIVQLFIIITRTKVNYNTKVPTHLDNPHLLLFCVIFSCMS